MLSPRCSVGLDGPAILTTGYLTRVPRGHEACTPSTRVSRPRRDGTRGARRDARDVFRRRALRALPRLASPFHPSTESDDMVKKFKAMAREAGSDGQLAAAIKDSAQQIWLAGLGAFSKAQE